MKYNQTEQLNEERFRRLTGLKRKTFDKNVEILREADQKKKVR